MMGVAEKLRDAEQREGARPDGLWIINCHECVEANGKLRMENGELADSGFIVPSSIIDSQSWAVAVPAGSSDSSNESFQLCPLLPNQYESQREKNCRADEHPAVAGEVDDDAVDQSAGAVAQWEGGGKTRHGTAASFSRRRFHRQRENARAADGRADKPKSAAQDQSGEIGRQ